MSKLIAVTVETRNGVDIGGEVRGFDVDDIISPIKVNLAGNTEFTTRMSKDIDSQNRNRGRAIYEVSETLGAIDALSYDLIKLTVIRRKNETVASVDYVFVISKIQESLITTGSGTKFSYLEEGDPNPVEYEVSDTLAAIIGVMPIAPASFDNGLTQTGMVVQLGGPLVQNTNIDFDVFSLSFSSVPLGLLTDWALTVDGSGNIRSIPVSSMSGITNSAGANVITKSDGTNLVASTILDDGAGNIDFGTDGQVNINGGSNLGYTFSVVQESVGFRVMDVHNANTSKKLVSIEDNLVNGYVILADNTMEVNAYSHHVGIGIMSNAFSRLRVYQDAAVTDIVAFQPAVGTGGTYISADIVTGAPFLSMQDPTAVTTLLINGDGDSYFNGGSLAIGALTVDASAILDLVSTTKGLLIPRMTTAQKNAIADEEALLVYDTDLGDFDYNDGADWQSVGKYEALCIPASDEVTALATGAGKMTFHMPYAMKLSEVFAGLTTPQAANGGGGIFTVDVNEAGSSILSTEITIDNTEETSLTAATPPVISDVDLAKGAKITIDIDQIGDGSAKGLKVYLIGRRIS
jgi:hypothetical protein